MSGGGETARVELPLQVHQQLGLLVWESESCVSSSSRSDLNDDSARPQLAWSEVQTCSSEGINHLSLHVSERAVRHTDAQDDGSTELVSRTVSSSVL